MKPRALPIAGVGTPGPYRLVAAFLVSSLVAFLVAAVATLAAAPDLARASFATPAVLLAAHLLALGFLPLAVAGAAFHLLPLVLRGRVSERRGWCGFALLLPGSLLAVGIARHAEAVTWVAVALVGAGLALVLGEAVLLVARSPRGRIVVVSRFGVVASATHAALGFVVGPLLFVQRWHPVAGIPHDRAIAIHLHLTVIGAVTLLIVTVGRTLVPMLAVAPTAPKRRFPGEEVALTGGLWLSLVGLALPSRVLVAAGGLIVAGAVARFLALVVRTFRSRRVPAVEGPLLHALAGVVFLVQTAVLGIVLVSHPLDARVDSAYALTLLVGWGVGVTLGHAGKLLALTAWTWWPPGPRPKQAAFYDRRLWGAEAVLFLASVELLVAGTLAGSTLAARAGGVLLVAAAVLALVGAARTLSLVPSPEPAGVPRAHAS